MDIANINAVSRYGSYPAPRAVVTREQQRAVTEATRNTTAIARGLQQPDEPVLQGELLQKRRKSSSYVPTDLLDSMRAMDRLLRDTATTSSDATPPRDARRAIASYTQQTIIPNTLTGATAAAMIDYFV
jgi:hypothetical protein